MPEGDQSPPREVVQSPGFTRGGRRAGERGGGRRSFRDHEIDTDHDEFLREYDDTLAPSLTPEVGDADEIPTLPMLEATTGGVGGCSRLTAYVANDSGTLKIYVRAGGGYWWHAIDEEMRQDGDITSAFTPTALPAAGDIACIYAKLSVVNSGASEDDPTWTIERLDTTTGDADVAILAVYDLTSNDTGGNMIQTYPLATVDENGLITCLRSGGDIVERRIG